MENALTEHVAELVAKHDKQQLNTMLETHKQINTDLMLKHKAMVDECQKWLAKFLMDLTGDDFQLRYFRIDKPFHFNNDEVEHQFVCTFDINFAIEETWRAELELKIYDDHIEMDMSTCGFYSKADHPNKVKAMRLGGKIWENEEETIEICKNYVDVSLLDAEITAHHNKCTIECGISKIEDIEAEAERKAKYDVYLTKLHNHVGKYLRWKDNKHFSEDYYRVIKVTDKTVKLQRCYFYNNALREISGFKQEKLEHVVNSLMSSNYMLFDGYNKEAE